jgi:hypothetical protein
MANRSTRRKSPFKCPLYKKVSSLEKTMDNHMESERNFKGPLTILVATFPSHIMQSMRQKPQTVAELKNHKRKRHCRKGSPSGEGWLPWKGFKQNLSNGIRGDSREGNIIAARLKKGTKGARVVRVVEKDF